MAADTLGGPSDSLPGDRRPGLTGVQWLICAIAAIGFAFDIYELLMAPLILPPAMREMSPFKPGTPEFKQWVGLWKGLMFFVPAFAGGVFGLLGGYLTDRLGRRRVLTWSILIYAFSAFFAGFSTNVYMLLVLRCTTFVGVCVEFVAAVAWLAEMFPEPRTRERVLGYTQAFSSIGGLMIAGANYLALQWAPNLPALHIPGFLHGFLGDIADPHRHEAWRYTVMSGLIPAIPLIVIRPFLPESPVWAARRAAGTLRRPSLGELFSPQLARTTLVTTVMFACSYGAAFGAIQQMPDIAPGLSDVKAKVAAAMAGAPARAPTTAIAPAATNPAAATQPGAAVDSARPKVSFPASAPSMRQMAATTPGPGARPGASPKDKIEQEEASKYSGKQEIGGLVGRVALAMLAAHVLSRRKLLRIFQVPGLIIVPLVFGWAYFHNTHLFTLPLPWGSVDFTTFGLGMFLAGLVTVAQFSFWGNYLPLVYPLHLRGTGESFAANIGGRMLGTSFAFVTTSIAGSSLFAAETPLPTRFAYTAAGVALFVYALGFVASFFLPEPGREGLAE
jgi:MFS family permease